MAEPRIVTRGVTWTPVSNGVTEAVHIRQLKKGTRILWMSARVDVPGTTNATQSLQLQATYGTYGATTILMTMASVGVGVTTGQIVDANTGPGMANAGGWLSSTDGFLDAVYNPAAQNGAGGTPPTVKIVYEEQKMFPQ